MLIANAGIPMLLLTLPGMVLALPVVVGIEAVLFKRDLGLGTKEALRVAWNANAASTFVGVPLTWFALVLLEMLGSIAVMPLLPSSEAMESSAAKFALLVLQAPWIADSADDGYWMLPAACLLLLPPFGVASYATERFVALRMLRGHDRGAVARSVRGANLVTYAGSGVLVAAWLAYRLLRGPG